MPSGKASGSWSGESSTQPSRGEASSKPRALEPRTTANPPCQGIRAGVCRRVPWLAGTRTPLTCKPIIAARLPQSCRSGVWPRRNTSRRIFSIASRRKGSLSSAANIWKQARVSSRGPLPRSSCRAVRSRWPRSRAEAKGGLEPPGWPELPEPSGISSASSTGATGASSSAGRAIRRGGSGGVAAGTPWRGFSAAPRG